MKCVNVKCKGEMINHSIDEVTYLHIKGGMIEINRKVIKNIYVCSICGSKVELK
ncbi:MAG: hypothetical protein WC307_05185 [Candidatus Nanoarchaeia archaeon]|jgi:hypothetical protein